MPLENPISARVKQRRLLSVDDAAQLVHLHRVTLMKMARTDPDFPHVIRLGSRNFFDLDELDRWIEASKLPKRRPGEKVPKNDVERAARFRRKRGRLTAIDDRARDDVPAA